MTVPDLGFTLDRTYAADAGAGLGPLHRPRR